MCLHETKFCQRCNASFECKAGTVMQCQCFDVTLTIEQRAYIEQRYDDCLCKNCLQYLQIELNLFKEKYLFR
jgi:hypothetical protein